ncbi:MAG: hypothetical protein K0S37_1988 [Microbacterium sp.]|jgi:hypothetical protein|nr:hypothetical protein [Microbacterium sp.]
MEDIVWALIAILPLGLAGLAVLYFGQGTDNEPG